VYHALNLSKQKTAKIIASWAKIIILFFTLMAVLNKVGIANEITNTILIWFISMLALAWWLAFWLWGKDIAHEILESFRK
jgi:di/tricarboxylate transporter